MGSSKVVERVKVSFLQKYFSGLAILFQKEQYVGTVKGFQTMVIASMSLIEKQHNYIQNAYDFFVNIFQKKRKIQSNKLLQHKYLP